MSINEDYFNAPVFESTKSFYACRYQSKLEFELMKRLDAAPKIKTYYQPLLTALVKNSDEEKFINVDFWIEYNSGKVDLLYIEKDFVISDKSKILILTNTRELLKPVKFEFAILNQNFQLRRIASANLKLSKTPAIEDFCFVSFNWVN